MLDILKRPSIQILALSTTATWIVGLTAPQSWAAVAVAVCWIAFGLYILVRLIRSGHFWIALLPIFFVIAIGVGVSLPYKTIHALLEPANLFLSRWKLPMSAGKYGHVFCFAMLTLFALAIRRKLSVPAKELTLFVFLLAIATEGFQLFIPGRTTNGFDLVLDLFGALLGFLIFVIYKRFVPNRKSDRKEITANERK